MANYPNAAIFFTQKTSTDTVVTPDVNLAYNEIQALGTAVGILPAQRTVNWGVTSWGVGGYTSLGFPIAFSSVGARIQNVEDATYITYTDYVSKSLGTTISPTTSTSIVNVTLKVGGLTAPVTAISANGTTITFTANNSFIAGQLVTITNAVTTAFNAVINFTVLSAGLSSSSFSVTSSITGATCTATATVSQTANLLEAKDISGTVTLASLSTSGTFQAVTIDGGTP